MDKLAWITVYKNRATVEILERDQVGEPFLPSTRYELEGEWNAKSAIRAQETITKQHGGIPIIVSGKEWLDD